MKKLGLIAGALGFAASGVASAAITAADLSSIGTEVQADAATVFAWVLPIIGVVLAMTVGINLLKKFGHKIG